MVFIIEILKSLFFPEKQEKQLLNLTNQQKKKYRKQYWSTMLPTLLLFLILIYSTGETIINFLNKGQFIHLGLAITFGYIIEKVAKNTKTQIQTIEERIQKRQKKNRKQQKENTQALKEIQETIKQQTKGEKQDDKSTAS